MVNNAPSGYSFIEYSTSSGTKRGYVAASGITLNNNTALAKMNTDSTTYSGPNTYYVKIGVVNLEEYVVILEKNSTFAYVEYNTKSGRKKAYLPLSNMQIFNTSSTIPGISITTDYKDATMSTAANVYGGPSLDNYSTIGSVGLNESVGVINVENGWLYIQYYTSSGPKRGYVLISQVNNGTNISTTVANKTKTYNGQNNSANKNATVYSGPGTSYATVGTVFLYEGFTQFTTQENSFYFIEYSTSSGTKRGFIQNTDLASREQGSLGYVINLTPVYYSPESNYQLGSIFLDEYITVLEKDASKCYVEYNTLSGRKRGYISNTSNVTVTNPSQVLSLQNTTNLYQTLSDRTVYSGPSGSYVTIGSVNKNEHILVINPNVFSDYAFIEYGTTSGNKRGYILNSSIIQLSGSTITQISYPVFENATQLRLNEVAVDTSYVSGENRPLIYYRIGNPSASNVMILNFAIHGYEDHFKQDGNELVVTAFHTIDYLQSNISLLNSNNMCVYVIPTFNPDGLLYPDGPLVGDSNSKGRHNTSMLVGGVLQTGDQKDIDLNRCFPYDLQMNFTPITPYQRYYTGLQAMMAREALALDKVIQMYKTANGSKKIFIDMHGWTQQIITDSSFLRNAFYGQFKGGLYENSYNLSNGYVAKWAGANGYTSCLFEFPSDVNNFGEILSKGYESKFFTVINNIITG